VVIAGRACERAADTHAPHAELRQFGDGRERSGEHVDRHRRDGAHDGELTAASAPGAGTTMTIALPVARQE
jgi:hypothetical protein